MAHVTPEDLQPTLEEIKNQITMGESEVRRLRDLQQSLKTEIDEQIKARKWNEEEVEKLQAEVKSLTKELSDRKDEIKESAEIVSKSKTVAANQDKREKAIATKHEESLAAIENERTSRLADVEKREAALVEKEVAHDAKAHELADKSNKLTAKLSDLAKVIDSVRQEL